MSSGAIPLWTMGSTSYLRKYMITHSHGEVPQAFYGTLEPLPNLEPLAYTPPRGFVEAVLPVSSGKCLTSERDILT